MKIVNYLSAANTNTNWLALAAFVISIIAVLIAFFNFYFQHIRKKSSVIFNLIPQDFGVNPLRNTIVLSNSGNTEVLIIGMEFSFIDKAKNDIKSSVIIKDNKPTFPILIKPKDISAIEISSELNLFNENDLVYEMKDGHPKYVIHLIIHSILFNGQKKESDIKLMDIVLYSPNGNQHGKSGYHVSSGKNILSKKNSTISKF